MCDKTYRGKCLHASIKTFFFSVTLHTPAPTWCLYWHSRRTYKGMRWLKHFGTADREVSSLYMTLVVFQTVFQWDKRITFYALSDDTNHVAWEDHIRECFEPMAPSELVGNNKVGIIFRLKRLCSAPKKAPVPLSCSEMLAMLQNARTSRYAQLMHHVWEMRGICKIRQNCIERWMWERARDNGITRLGKLHLFRDGTSCRRDSPMLFFDIAELKGILDKSCDISCHSVGVNNLWRNREMLNWKRGK